MRGLNGWPGGPPGCGVILVGYLRGSLWWRELKLLRRANLIKIEDAVCFAVGNFCR